MFAEQAKEKEGCMDVSSMLWEPRGLEACKRLCVLPGATTADRGEAIKADAS